MDSSRIEIIAINWYFDPHTRVDKEQGVEIFLRGVKYKYICRGKIVNYLFNMENLDIYCCSHPVYCIKFWFPYIAVFAGSLIPSLY